MELNPRSYADTMVLRPSGRLDHDASEAFRASMQPLLEREARDGRSLVLDLSGLEYVSSAGLRCFVLAAKQAAAQGGKVSVAALRPLVSEIFQISRFHLLFEIHPSLRDALSAASPQAAAEFDRK